MFLFIPVCFFFSFLFLLQERAIYVDLERRPCCSLLLLPGVAWERLAILVSWIPFEIPQLEGGWWAVEVGVKVRRASGGRRAICCTIVDIDDIYTIANYLTK